MSHRPNTPTVSDPPAALPRAGLFGLALPLSELRAAGVVDIRAMPVILARILRLAARCPWRLSLSVGASLGAALFGLLLPRLLGAAVDQVQAQLTAQGHIDSRLWLTAGLILAAASLRGMLQMAAGVQAETASQRVGYDLRLAYFDQLQRLGFDYHDRVHSGDLITRGMLDLEGVRMFIEAGLQRIVLLAMLLVVGAALQFSTDPLMALLSLSFVPIVGWQAARMGLVLRLTWTLLQNHMSNLTRVMEENLQGVRVVRAFAAQAFELMKFDAIAAIALRLSNRRIVVRTGSNALMTLTYYAATGLVLWVGGHRVAAGAMTIGQLIEFLTFMAVLQTPVRQLNMVVNSCARATSSGQRLFEILDLTPVIRDAPDAAELRLSEGVLVFDHVGFAYGGRPVLRDISFTLRPGRTLGIVGASGAGKTTLAHLIARFYDVTAGRITIDGQDIRNVTLKSLRQAVTIIQQDVFLFDSSLADNIVYAEPGAADDRLRAAAQTAQIYDHIAALPKGWRTRTGERGVALSGGQRQRLSIARGVLPRPAILVLDDVTSAVDAATEQRIRSELLAAGRMARIVIGHRLNSVMHADEILVLEGGRIAERGSHAELLARGGHYADLFRLQSRPSSVPTELERAWE